MIVRNFQILCLTLGLLTIGVGAVAIASETPPEQPPADPVLHDRIMEAAVHGGRLWLRGPDSLVSFKVNGGDRKVHFTADVESMAVGGGAVWVLRGSKDTPRSYSILRLTDGEFRPFASFQTQGKDPADGVRFRDRLDWIIGLVFTNGAIAVLTDTKMREWDIASVRMRERPLTMNNPFMGPLSQTSLAMTRDGAAIYIGYNRGEWGGELERIDLRTGKATTIRSTLRDVYVSNITGLVADPERANCMIASMGESHLGLTSGGVIRACGDKPDRILRSSISLRIFDDTPREVEEPIFALTAARNGCWAAGIGHVFHYVAGKWQTLPMPELANENGIWMSRSIPGLLILSTDLNRAHAVSANTPLIVSIEPAP